MGDWDAVFDETYLQTYEPFVDPERTRAEALGAAGLADVQPGAEILHCPCGYGRHSLVLADEGYRVTGLDRSQALLAEAERRRGEAEWPRLVHGDYRELPFEDASFDAVFNSSRRSATSGAMRTSGCSASCGECCGPAEHSSSRPGIGTRWLAGRSATHGSAYPTARSTSRSARSTAPQERSRTRGSSSRPRAGESSVHVYSATEWTRMLREAGFGAADAFGGWDGETPITPDRWRLILRAR
jgi:Methyltransferase domain